MAITPHERYKEVYFYQQRSTSGVLVKCRRRAFAEKKPKKFQLRKVLERDLVTWSYTGSYNLLGLCKWHLKELRLHLQVQSSIVRCQCWVPAWLRNGVPSDGDERDSVFSIHRAIWLKIGNSTTCYLFGTTSMFKPFRPLSRRVSVQPIRHNHEVEWSWRLTAFFVPYSDVHLTYACDKTVGKLCYVLPLKSFVIILTWVSKMENILIKL